VEWIWGVVLMTNEDKEDCLTLLKEMKILCIELLSRSNKDSVSFDEFVYAIDQCTNVLIEIIENKPLEIKRMF
jgi:hypothetical protein